MYLIKYSTIEEAVALQNGVPQGLSSAIMTLNIRESELFLSHASSDCRPIANVNIGTSGAKSAVHSEAKNRWRPESSSDAWKLLRRQTNTINFGDKNCLWLKALNSTYNSK